MSDIILGTSGLVLNRRTFLSGLVSLSLVPRWENNPPLLETEADLEEAWSDLTEEPVEFWVDHWGTLNLGGLARGPRTRAEAFDLPVSYIETTSGLADAVEGVRPALWHVEGMLADLRDAYGVDGGDWDEARRRWCEETDQTEDAYLSRPAFDALAALPEEISDIDSMANLLASLPEDLLATVREGLTAWLEHEPDWLQEADYFDEFFRPHEAALRYFSDLGLDRDLQRALGICIVEGEHPGSTYYAVELTVPIEDANQRARDLGIPVCFVEKVAPLEPGQPMPGALPPMTEREAMSRVSALAKRMRGDPAPQSVVRGPEDEEAWEIGPGDPMRRSLVPREPPSPTEPTSASSAPPEPTSAR